MAKKKARRKIAATSDATTAAKLTAKDKRTLKAIRGMADNLVETANRKRPPHLDIPSRSLGNVRYNRSKRFIEMGSGKNRRELFNLSQAKSYMQTMLVGSGCKKLIDQGKTTSIRGLYYLLKHTIEGTREETFDEQSDCDPIIEDVEVALRLDRPVAPVLAALAERDILGGYDLGAACPEFGEALLVCATETKTEADIEAYVAAFADILADPAPRKA